MGGDANAAVRRVSGALGLDAGRAVDLLATEVSGADLTSFLLEVMRRRAENVSPADVMRRARTDPFVEPGTVDARALHRVIAEVLAAVPTSFEVAELSPVVPLGTHSTVATVHQHKIVSTIRNTEVAADPTNALALLAAIRRPDGITRLGAVQRILRAQPFGDQGQQHFSVLGLVTAGRDRGHMTFETDAIVEQLHVLRSVIGAVTNAAIELRLTDLGGGPESPLVDAVAASFAHHSGATRATLDPERTSGRGYYRDLCFKIVAVTADRDVEIGDGGFTDWMAQLRNNRKARLLTSGLGLDRLVTVAAAHPAS